MVATSQPTHTPQQQWDATLRLSYLEAGESGPVVLLLHGLGGFKELWWSTLIALAPHYRAFALDMPGHGASPLAGQGRMAGLAEVVEAFCAAQGLHELILVGHSMGGNIALELTLKRPELVQRLVLVDAAADLRDGIPVGTLPLACVAVGWPYIRISQGLRKLMKPLGARVPHVHADGLLLPMLRRQAYAAAHDPAAQYALMAGLFDNAIGERAGQVRVPTLVMTGQFDTLVPPTHARDLARRIPGSRYAVVRGAMHNPMDERPAQFEQILLEFIGGERTV